MTQSDIDRKNTTVKKERTIKRGKSNEEEMESKRKNKQRDKRVGTRDIKGFLFVRCTK